MIGQMTMSVVKLTSSDDLNKVLEIERRQWDLFDEDIEEARDIDEFYAIFMDGDIVACIRVNTDPFFDWDEEDGNLEMMKQLDPQIWIASLVVRPAYRGRGLAKRLKQHLHQLYSRIASGTSQSLSDPAMDHINEKMGYRVQEEREDCKIWFWNKDFDL